ncbi:sigma-70 family RNA polymerase sigma factor [Nakamurella flava]|uniref:RNA polymerase sigma factor n=1 Tax=Nakamurella flava TaxID=2576308 RepID=A0A4U6QLB4_9ACTN|nr:sigma-70 family RNA polymerase sigma factor [Nakamurella flava]TKV60932.1 sigma-70 family RNA polymerase sigma factor [Nakamurella flava]
MSTDGSWAQAERWVPAAVAGDPTAVDQLIRCTQADVWRFIASLAGRGEADDLTQETYLRALRALGGFEGRSGLRTWLLVIARRTVVDHLRRQASRPRTADLDDWTVPAERAAARWRPSSRSSGAATEVTDLLDRLPVERREALVLTQLVGLGYAEAADVIGCPVGTVRSRVARAREELATMLAAGGGQEGPSAAAR